MEKNVRVYAVEKKNGWDVLSHAQQKVGKIPNTVTHVHVAWGDGKGDKATKLTKAEFLLSYEHQHGCNWIKKDVA
jgi:hypothetical protein